MTCWNVFKSVGQVQNAPVHVIEGILSASMRARVMLVNNGIINGPGIYYNTISTKWHQCAFLNLYILSTLTYFKIVRWAVTNAKIQFAPLS